MVHRISRRQAGKVAHKTETNEEEAGASLDEGTAPPMTTDENSPSQAVTKVASETDADKNSDKNSGPGPGSSSEEKSDSKENPKCDTKKIPKSTKTRVKRPFGSIRCRSCNRYGVTSKCPCSPSARYAVMIQSKRISKDRQREIKRVEFA